MSNLLILLGVEILLFCVCFVFTQQDIGQRIGNKPYIYEIDQFEAVDVDTAEDFEFAKAVAAYLADKGDSQK